MGEVDIENDAIETEVADLETEEATVGTEEDGAEEAEDAEEDETAEEDDESDGDEELGQRARKRIQKLVGARKDAEKRVKELERQLEEAKKLGGDDGMALLSAAERSGILPSLMTKELAAGLEALSRKESALAGISHMLDGEDEEFTLGDTVYSRRAVERKERQLREEVRDLKDRFGGQKTELQKKVREIFELGMKAQKAGWKPGEKRLAKKQVLKDQPEGDRKAPKGKRASGVDFREVGNADDLEEMIVQMRRKG